MASSALPAGVKSTFVNAVRMSANVTSSETDRAGAAGDCDDVAGVVGRRRASHTSELHSRPGVMSHVGKCMRARRRRTRNYEVPHGIFP